MIPGTIGVVFAPMAVALILWLGTVEQAKSYERNANRRLIVVRNPIAYFVVGYTGFALFYLFLVLSWLDRQIGWLTTGAFSLFCLLSLGIIWYCHAYRLEIDTQTDYFVYRNIWFRKKRIPYADCKYYYVGREQTCLFIADHGELRELRLSQQLVGLHSLMDMLHQYNTGRLKNHPKNKKR